MISYIIPEKLVVPKIPSEKAIHVNYLLPDGTHALKDRPKEGNEDQILDNTPVSGIKILPKKHNNKYEMITLQDPRGFKFNMDAETFCYFITKGMHVENNEIKSSVVYIGRISVARLVICPTSSEDYKIALTKNEAKNQKRIDGDELKVGAMYRSSADSEYVFLGRKWIIYRSWGSPFICREYIRYNVARKTFSTSMSKPGNAIEVLSDEVDSFGAIKNEFSIKKEEAHNIEFIKYTKFIAKLEDKNFFRVLVKNGIYYEYDWQSNYAYCHKGGNINVYRAYRFNEEKKEWDSFNSSRSVYFSIEDYNNRGYIKFS